MEAFENDKGGRKMARNILTVENYIDFIDDRTLRLSVRQLREIINMHGFKKIEAPKALHRSNPVLLLVLHLYVFLNFFYGYFVLILFGCYDLIQCILTEMVSSMDLMDLHRSTLLDGGVSGDACLTLEEVIKDLKSVDWQDCHVTSLLAYGAGGAAPSATGKWIVSMKRKRSRRSRKKAVKVAVDNPVISTTGTTIVAGSTTEMSVC